MKKLNLREVIEWTCRLYVFVFLNFYGLAKLIGGQFYTPDRMPEEVALMPLAEAPNFELAWTFMGRSFGYMTFIALSEIIGAWLLLFNRTKLLGASMLLIVLMNVIVFDIFFLDKYGALGSATIYFLLLSVVLYLNKNQIVEAFNSLTRPSENTASLKEKALIFGAAILLMAIIFGIDQTIVNLLGHGKG
ncbi:MAG: hypothetical protein AAFR66_21170 [Bacteroidota bacterium]